MVNRMDATLTVETVASMSSLPGRVFDADNSAPLEDTVPQNGLVVDLKGGVTLPKAFTAARQLSL